jgi:hypothetical protein
VGSARQRERACACKEETALTGRPHRAAGERERERAGWRRQVGLACQAPRARARAGGGGGGGRGQWAERGGKFIL